jgi:CubicO group peptidase (beta-lactamase class C family)
MRVKALLATALLSFMTAVGVDAESLPSIRPEQVGLSSERLQRIMDTLKADVDKRIISWAIVLVARHGKIAYFAPVGVRDPATKVPMTKDSIFRIYSMSKPITSVAAMMLWEEGRFNLAEPVSKYIPQLGGLKVGVEKPDPSGGNPTLELVPTKRDMSIQDLFRHTSGLTYGFFGPGQVKKMHVEAKVWNDSPSNAELVDRLAKLPLVYQPGTTWDYSHSTDVLGRLVEVISRQSLCQFEKERVLDPIGMKDTSFYVTDKTKQSRIAESFPDDRSIGVDAEFNDPRVVLQAESGGGWPIAPC